MDLQGNACTISKPALGSLWFSVETSRSWKTQLFEGKVRTRLNHAIWGKKQSSKENHLSVPLYWFSTLI